MMIPVIMFTMMVDMTVAGTKSACSRAVAGVGMHMDTVGMGTLT